MFCLYCGTDIPEDAVFCNKCGRRQNAAMSVSDVTVLPIPPIPGAPVSTGQMPAGTVPMVQGTPAIPNSSPLGEGVAGSAGAPGGAAATSSRSSSPFQPRPAPHAPMKPQNVSSSGVKLTGHLSRRAVMLALAGGIAMAVAGGGLALVVLTRQPQKSPISAGSTNPTAIPSPPSTPTPTAPQSKVYHVAVESSTPPPGVDTGITLTAGDQITITAQGWVTFGSGSDPTCDTSSNSVNIRVNPDGQRENVDGVSCPPRMDQYISHPDFPVGELMAGILPVGTDTSQTWFAAGSSYTGTISTSGQLYLLFNDGYYADNIGQYQVAITVTPS